MAFGESVKSSDQSGQSLFGPAVNGSKKEVANKKHWGKKKRGKMRADANKSNVNLRIANTDARSLPFTAWDQRLTGPAKWLGEKEKRAYYEFGYGSATISAATKKRLQKNILFGFLGGIAVFIVLRYFQPHMVGIKVIALSIVAMFVLAWLLWFNASHQAMVAYRNNMFRRQLVFIQFERLLIPYLAEMKDGVSLYSMLKRVSNRLSDPNDQVLVERLMVQLGEGANTSAPFIDFARRFGGSDSARLFMLSVYQMYAGNYNDEIVKDLGDQSNRQMMQQVDLIIKAKLKRFNMLPTWLTMATAIVLFAYLGAVIVQSFQSIGGGF